MVIPIYQPLGASTHQIAKRIGEKYGEKATHTGTLDPLAEGVVIVLIFCKLALGNHSIQY